jgi:hypothetical protein
VAVDPPSQAKEATMHSRFLQLLVTALAMGAAIAPAAAASGDLRSPDARDAASAIARDTSPPISVDLRSPDARDSALDRIPVALATPVARATTPTELSARDPSWFDWPSAAIGAAALAVLLLTAGLTTAARHTRRHVRT